MDYGDTRTKVTEELEENLLTSVAERENEKTRLNGLAEPKNTSIKYRRIWMRIPNTPPVPPLWFVGCGSDLLT